MKYYITFTNIYNQQVYLKRPLRKNTRTMKMNSTFRYEFSTLRAAKNSLNLLLDWGYIDAELCRVKTIDWKMG